jgi:Na+/H+ antiporter NhaD/arsenite permease-like protein
MHTEMVALKVVIGLIFILAYAAMMKFQHKRPQVVWIAVGILFIFVWFYKVFHQANLFGAIFAILWNFITLISWNVLAIFTGTSIMAHLFIESKVPAWLADWFVARSKTAGIALLWICALTGAISAFVDNVSTVLIVAPIGVAICQRLKISPVACLIGMAISANLQGTATMIGDPPSMIAAGFLSQRWGERVHFGFNEFFMFQGKPSLFFAVQFGAIAAFIVLYLFFKKYRQPVVVPEEIRIQSMVPTYILLGVLCGLAFSTKFDPNFMFFGGTWCMFGALVALTWQNLKEGATKSGHNFQKGLQANLAILKHYDLETPIFLAGIFILVKSVEQSGLIGDIAAGIQMLLGNRLFLTYLVIVWISVFLSGFIDNIPYIMVMLPLMAELGERIAGPASPACYVLAFGLLIGACLGGNCTPIGASANVVAMGIAKKNGYPVSFGEFMKMGIPFTVVATLAGSMFVWWIWQ